MEEMIFWELEVVETKEETAEASTLWFKVIGQDKVPFIPGQFITLLLTINGKPLRRSYSISSAKEGALFSITVKKVANGEVSRYLVEGLQVGNRLKALPPAGRFIHKMSDRPRDVFMLAAGSGISPFRPMIQQILSAEPQSQIHLIYSNSTPKDTIFHDELLQSEGDRLHVRFLFSRGSAEQLPERLNNNSLEKWVKEEMQFEASGAIFYLCGPPDYMRMAAITLHFMGFAKEQILKEQFVVPEQAISEAFTFRKNSASVDLFYRSKKYSFKVGPKKTVLQAALEEGVLLPYSCNAGICATCVSVSRQGQVQMSYNEVLTDQEVEQGKILTCVAYPVSDFVEIWVGHE